MSKAAIRNEVRDRLRALAPDERAEHDGRILERVMALPAFQRSQRVFCYLPLPHEVNTRPLVEALLEVHGTAYVPVTDPDERALRVAELTSMAELAEGAFGVPEPRGPRVVDPTTIDLWIVPGVAFDARGYRVGHGGGYFDAFFGAHPTDALKVALAYARQMVDEVPASDHDVPVDLVVTEAEIWIAEEA